MPEAEKLEDARRKRLRYRAWHRGTKESDIILGTFADARLAGFSDAELQDFETLLDVEDPKIYDWVTGLQPVPAEDDSPVIQELLKFKIVVR
jgi:antitoxin CptB